MTSTGRLTLTIEFQGARTAYRPGERISGAVRVDATEPWAADHLDIILFWRTEGKGNSERGVFGLQHIIKRRGEMVPPNLRQPFQFQFPTHPWTYHGQILKINWWVGIYAKPQRQNEQFLEVPVELGIFPAASEVPPPL